MMHNLAPLRCLYISWKLEVVECFKVFARLVAEFHGAKQANTTATAKNKGHLQQTSVFFCDDWSWSSALGGVRPRTRGFGFHVLRDAVV